MGTRSVTNQMDSDQFEHFKSFIWLLQENLNEMSKEASASAGRVLDGVASDEVTKKHKEYFEAIAGLAIKTAESIKEIIEDQLRRMEADNENVNNRVLEEQIDDLHAALINVEIAPFTEPDMSAYGDQWTDKRLEDELDEKRRLQGIWEEKYGELYQAATDETFSRGTLNNTFEEIGAKLNEMGIEIPEKFDVIQVAKEATEESMNERDAIARVNAEEGATEFKERLKNDMEIASEEFFDGVFF